MVRRLAALAIALLTTACTAASPPRPPAEPPDPPAAQPAAADEVGSTNPVEALPLEIVMTDQTTTGRLMKLRGKVVNPHAETVTGVRIQLVFLAPDGEGGAKVLEIQQMEMEATIEPDGAEMLRWDVESMYLSPMGQFALVAYPKRLGERDLPPPDHWNE